MKVTKKEVLSYVREMLATNKAWAIKALVRIYTENQTAQEQAIEATTEDNGIGFTGTDGNFLSSLARQQIEKGFLSEKQMALVFAKMPKYARQVIAFADTEKLNAQVASCAS